MRAGILVAVMLCCLALGPAAAGAAPFQLSAAGHSPDVAVAEDGTGHFVWTEPGSSGVPDTTRYCRVPPGQTICDAFVGLVPGTGGSDGLGRSPRVLLPAPGRVLVLTGRGNTDTVYGFLSADGGATFDAGRPLGKMPFDQMDDAALGPGNAVSLAYGGGRYQRAPLTGPGPTEAFADLEAGSGWADSVALLDADTPMLAMDVDGPGGREIRVRRYDGAGAHNTAANWTPAQTVAAGQEPVLRTGPGGTFLAYVSREGDAPRLALRRLEGGGFGPAKVLQEDSTFPRYADLAADPGGGLHALWVKDGISYRSAPDGSGWGPIVELFRSEGHDFNARLAANGAHHGFAVADSNETGVVTAIPFSPDSTKPPPPPPPGGGDGGGGPGGGGGASPGDPACRTAAFGIVEARLASGCFAREGPRFVATGVPVRINGLDAEPLAGSTRIVLDPAARTVTSTGLVKLSVGGIPIDVDALAWNVPADKPRVTLAGPFEAEDKGDKTGMLGFPIKGSAKVDLLDKRSEVGLHVGLPTLFKGLTGDVTLRADNVVGLRFDGLEIRAPHAQSGPLEVKDLLIRYMVGGNFLGSGQLILPPNPPGATLTASFSFVDAAFAHAQGDFKPATPVPLASGVFMTHLGFGLFVQPPPTKITGQIGIIGGPQVAGKAALQLEGEAFYEFALPPKPAHLHLGATASIAGFIDAGKANLDYFSNGLVTFDAQIAKSLAGLFSIDVGVEGFVDFPAEQFSFDGNGTGCFVGYCPATVGSTISSKGIAACAKVLVPMPGLAYRWGDPIWTAIKFFGCDAEGYKVAAPPKPTARAAQAASTVVVDEGTPTLSLAVRGEGAVPHVELVAPGGAVVAATPAGGEPASGPGWAAGASSSEHTAYFGITRPDPGRWTVRPAAGSAPVAQVASAEGLPPVEVRASVRGKGRRRGLAYRVKRIPGQRVLFVERSKTVAAVLGSTRGGRGTLRFAPADGAAGRRTVEAIVEQDGIVRRRLRVASYVAPGPVRPERVRGLRVRRRGSTARLTWRPADDAVRYKASVRVDDGRRQLFFLGARERRLVIPDVRRRTRGRVRVVGLRPDLREGRAATVKLGRKAKRKRDRRA